MSYKEFFKMLADTDLDFTRARYIMCLVSAMVVNLPVSYLIPKIKMSRKEAFGTMQRYLKASRKGEKRLIKKLKSKIS
jgi:predicted secreted Zn-dependent protease